MPIEVISHLLEKLYYQFHWSTHSLDKRIREKNISGLEIFLIKRIFQPFCQLSLSLAVKTGSYQNLYQRLCDILPELNVELSEFDYNKSVKNQERICHVCQCEIFLKFIDLLTDQEKINVVDIGDNSGKQITYFKNLVTGKDINGLSVNLDPHVVKAMKQKGFEAILCRAEDLDLEDRKIDTFCTFSMIEHLHDPVGFLYKLATKGNSEYLIIGTPYYRNSRVGLWDVKHRKNKIRKAETTHIFELSPTDWALLFQHSGWQVIHENITYYYPFRKTPIGCLFAAIWRFLDTEGYYCVLLKRNTEIMDTYLDWAY